MSNTVDTTATPGTLPASEPAGGRGTRHRGLALGLILVAQLLVVIDVSIVTLALPAIGHALHFSATGLQWVISGYALAFGGLLLGGVVFPMFVFLSLYMQQVLGYSAIKTGLAFLVIAAGMIVSSAAGQHLVTRAGAKVVLTGGLLGLAAAQALFIRLPVAGSYAAHLLPGFVLVAAALGVAFVGDFIASTTGVESADAGMASGLINTSQQIGGAIGLAVTTTIAASRTAALLHTGQRPAAALTAGFHGAFAVSGALALAAGAIAAILIPRTRQPGPATPAPASAVPARAGQPPSGERD